MPADLMRGEWPGRATSGKVTIAQIRVCAIAAAVMAVALPACVLAAIWQPSVHCPPRPDRTAAATCATAGALARPRIAIASDWPGPRISDWPGPRALEHLPEFERGETRRLPDAVRAAGDDELALSVLGLPYTGITTKAQPTLYWFVSEPLDRTIKIKLYREGQSEAVLDLSLESVTTQGIQTVSLADQGVSLEPGVEYEFVVALPRAGGPALVSSTTLRRIEPPADLARALGNASLERRAPLLIEHGIWFDALEVLAMLVERDPRWRGARARLLEDAGLDAAAGHEAQG